MSASAPIAGWIAEGFAQLRLAIGVERCAQALEAAHPSLADKIRNGVLAPLYVGEWLPEVKKIASRLSGLQADAIDQRMQVAQGSFERLCASGAANKIETSQRLMQAFTDLSASPAAPAIVPTERWPDWLDAAASWGATGLALARWANIAPDLRDLEDNAEDCLGLADSFDRLCERGSELEEQARTLFRASAMALRNSAEHGTGQGRALLARRRHGSTRAGGIVAGLSLRSPYAMPWSSLAEWVKIRSTFPVPPANGKAPLGSDAAARLRLAVGLIDLYDREAAEHEIPGRVWKKLRGVADRLLNPAGLEIRLLRDRQSRHVDIEPVAGQSAESVKRTGFLIRKDKAAVDVRHAIIQAPARAAGPLRLPCTLQRPKSRGTPSLPPFVARQRQVWAKRRQTLPGGEIDRRRTAGSAVAARPAGGDRL